MFKRKKPTGSPCPRCTQLVSDDRVECPMCGWDVREAYQGPATSPHFNAAEDILAEPREG
jgi:hypothetical protein